MNFKAAFDALDEAAKAQERERCIKIVEEIPASASLYENVDTAKAVIAFKEYAIKLMRGPQAGSVLCATPPSEEGEPTVTQAQADPATTPITRA